MQSDGAVEDGSLIMRLMTLVLRLEAKSFSCIHTGGLFPVSPVDLQVMA